MPRPKKHAVTHDTSNPDSLHAARSSDYPDWDEAVKSVADEAATQPLPAWPDELTAAAAPDAAMPSPVPPDGPGETVPAETESGVSLAGVTAYFDAGGESPAPVVVEQENLLRVKDAEGHLLFCYNAATRCVEIVRHGKKFAMSTDTLRNAAARNFISESRQVEFVAKEA